MSKYGHRTINWFEAIVNKLGGEEAAEAFLRDEISDITRRLLRDELSVPKPAPKWREENGVIYFSVGPTDGTTGPDWITRLEGKLFVCSRQAQQVLHSPDFKQTSGVTTELAILKSELFKAENRSFWTTPRIRAEAAARKLLKSNAEVACLIREKFTDEEIKAMGLSYIITMHEPIYDEVLQVSITCGGRDLSSVDEGPVKDYGSSVVRTSISMARSMSGFAFVVSEHHEG